jgi:hypothetical protein
MSMRSSIPMRMPTIFTARRSARLLFRLAAARADLRRPIHDGPDPPRLRLLPGNAARQQLSADRRAKVHRKIDAPIRITGAGGTIASVRTSSSTATSSRWGFASAMWPIAAISAIFRRKLSPKLEGLDVLIIDALQYRTIRAICRWNSRWTGSRWTGSCAETRDPHPYAHAARLRHGDGRDTGACRAGL